MTHEEIIEEEGELEEESPVEKGEVGVQDEDDDECESPKGKGEAGRAYT
jgi:hypothetical protein